jgi:hypothetical protein
MVSEEVAARVRSYIRHQAGKPPEVIAALVEDSQQRLLAAFVECERDVAERKPAPDEWSMHDLARHVVSAEGGVCAAIERLSHGDAPLTERRVGGQPADDGASYDELVDRLRTTNARLLDIIRSLPPDADTTTTALHPFFGELNCREWAAFQRVHDEDHIQHAAKIVA